MSADEIRGTAGTICANVCSRSIRRNFESQVAVNFFEGRNFLSPHFAEWINLMSKI